ncbi:hypothetical protein BDW69DRAFT_182081 [Aspergillus filifer]
MSAYGEEMLAIRQYAARNKMYVGFGFSEHVDASLYLAQVLIGPDGNILMHCRKTKPTHVELDTPLGRIGMLNCWCEKPRPC